MVALALLGPSGSFTTIWMELMLSVWNFYFPAQSCTHLCLWWQINTRATCKVIMVMHHLKNDLVLYFEETPWAYCRCINHAYQFWYNFFCRITPSREITIYVEKNIRCFRINFKLSFGMKSQMICINTRWSCSNFEYHLFKKKFGEGQGTCSIFIERNKHKFWTLYMCAT